MPSAEPAHPRGGRLLRELAPGVMLTVVVAGLALAGDTALTATGTRSPGPAVLALALGTLTATVRAPGPGTRPGLRWSSTRLLQAGIVLLGLTVPLAALTQVGPRALPVVAAAVIVSFATATVLGRLLGVGRDLRLLLGAGTGVCGASAIAAAAGVLRPRPADVSYALSTVVVMNLVAIAALPPLARALDLDGAGFGAWVGAAVNDTSAVVALSGAWSPTALAVAVVVKLTRVLALVPVILVLAWRTRVRETAEPAADGTAARRGARGLVPPFLLLFVAAVALGATGVLPVALVTGAALVVDVLVAAALAAVGLSTRLRDVARAGPAPVVLGALVWLAVAAATLLTLRLVGLA